MVLPRPHVPGAPFSPVSAIAIFRAGARALSSSANSAAASGRFSVTQISLADQRVKYNSGEFAHVILAQRLRVHQMLQKKAF